MHSERLPSSTRQSMMKTMSCATALSRWLLAALLATAATPAWAATWHVAPGGTGTGSKAAPFGRVQDALQVARPGDTISLQPGTYPQGFRSVRAGTAAQPIRIRAVNPRRAIVTASGLVARIDHAYLVIEGLVLDGQFGTTDTVRVAKAATGFTLRDTEVRRSSRDLVDIAGASQVLIENSLLHHALNAAKGRTDAHGIVAGAVRDLVVRDTEIHTFSGDGLQVDPGRSQPGWTRVLLERTKIWLAPLAAPTNGFAAGVVPGENGVDTKAGDNFPRAQLTIRDSSAWGFRGGLLANMAAFNLKEHVEVEVDGVTVHSSEIAFRLRGPVGAVPGAHVVVKNAVVYESGTAFRYENDIEVLKVWNSTIGRNVGRAFHAADSGHMGLDVRNVLVLGTLPAVAADPSNRGVAASAFINAAAHNYALAPGSPAIDAGTELPEVRVDRNRTPRPQGRAYDIGAYER